MSDMQKKEKKTKKSIQKNNFETNTEKINKREKNKTSNSQIYLEYNTRIILYSIAFLIFFVLTIYALPKTLFLSDQKTINYQENSELDYKVYLKDNSFYETEYLEKDKIYVASIIDKILIDFNYSFNIEEKMDINFNYDIVAKLSINDEVTQSNYFEKEYVLSSNNENKMVNDNNYNIKDQVSIDYEYYNSLANRFKQSYGVETASNLTVYLRINKENGNNATISNTDNSAMFIKIPLSEKAVNIEMNYQEINDSNYMIEVKDSIVDNIIYILISIVSFVFTIAISIRLIRLLTLLQSKKSVYDKYVNRILNEYDRLIVENFTGPDLEKNNIIKITKFEELLDVRDNLKLPIMYYNISKHNKCYFYIKHETDLYLMIVKAIDLEESNNEKK